MARIKNVSTYGGAPATSHTIPIPKHVSGDLLVVCVNGDGGALSSWSGSWSSIVANNGTNNEMDSAYLVASSSSETLTVTWDSIHDLNAIVVCIEGQHATPIGDSGTRNGSVLYHPITSGSVTTTATNSLVLAFTGGDGANSPAADSWTNLGQIHAELSAADVSLGCAYSHVTGTGVTVSPDFHTPAVVHTASIVIEIKDSGSLDYIPPYVQRDESPGVILEPGYYTTSNNSFNNSNPGSITIGTVGSQTTVYDAPSARTYGHINPNWIATLSRNAANTTSQLTGHQLDFDSAKDITGKIILYGYRPNLPVQKFYLSGEDDGGLTFSLRDGSAYKTWTIGAGDSKTFSATDMNIVGIQGDQSTDTSYASSGTVVNTAVDGVMLLSCNPTGEYNMDANYIVAADVMSIAGGTSSNPLNWDDIETVVSSSLGVMPLIRAAGSAATFLCPLKFGGTDPVNLSINNKTFQLREAATSSNRRHDWHVDGSAIGFEFEGNASDNLDLANCTFTAGTQGYWTITSGYAPNTDDFTGVVVINFVVTLQSGFDASTMTFTDCTVTQNNATMTGCAFTNTLVTSDNPADISSSAFTSGGTGHAIEIDTAGTYSFTGNTFSGYGADTSTDAAIYNNSGGAVTINLGSGDSTPTYRNGAGASTTINAYTDTLTVDSNVSATIRIYTTTTTTILSSATGTQDTYVHTGETVDITVEADGYLKYRQVGLVLSGSPTVDVTLEADPVYDSSHGLTITTDYDYNASTRVLTIAAAQELRNIYSSLAEEFRTNSAYRNKPFPIQAVGIDRFDFLSDGTTAATIDSGDIQYVRGAGFTIEHATTGNHTARYCYIKGTGTNAAGTKGYYQQVDGASPTALTLTSNNIAQAIQYYRDDNGDGDTSDTDEYNYSGHLIVKLFNDGYYQAAANVLTAFDISALEPQEYIVAMGMTETGLGTGDRSITITVTDNTPSGVEEETGYTFDYHVEGGAADSPEDLLRQWIYDVYTDPTASDYASKVNFNWPDPILESGGNYETKRGYVYGQDTTTTYSGFYVEEGTAYHPDFLRQQANDGTYFTTPVVSQVSFTGMPTTGADIRLQIWNVTAAASSAWQASTSYSVGDRVLRTSGIGTESTAGLYMLCTTAGTSNDTEPTWDTTAGNTTADTAGTGAGDVVWTTYKILFHDADPSSASYSTTYTDGEEFASGDTAGYRFAEMDGATSFKITSGTAVVAASGFSVAVSVTADSVYATNATDGSSAALESAFSPDFTNDYIVLDANTDFAGVGAYAYYCYTLTTSAGMWNFWGGVTALDVSNYRINNTVLNLYFDESAGFVKQTDNVRIFRADGARPAIDPTTGGNGIEMNWRNPVYGYDAGGGGFTSGDRATLEAASTLTQANVRTAVGLASANLDTQLGTLSTHDASDVVDAIEAAVPAVNIKKVNDVTVGGAGTSNNPFGPA